MPVFSYLAIPRSGARQALCTALAALPHCDILPADNQDVVVLVTDTPDERAEESLQQALKRLPSLQSLSLAFGFDDNEQHGR